MKNLKRAVAWILCAAMLMGMGAVQVFAAGESWANPLTSEQDLSDALSNGTGAFYYTGSVAGSLTIPAGCSVHMENAVITGSVALQGDATLELTGVPSISGSISVESNTAEVWIDSSQLNDLSDSGVGAMLSCITTTEANHSTYLNLREFVSTSAELAAALGKDYSGYVYRVHMQADVTLQENIRIDGDAALQLDAQLTVPSGYTITNDGLLAVGMGKLIFDAGSDYNGNGDLFVSKEAPNGIRSSRDEGLTGFVWNYGASETNLHWILSNRTQGGSGSTELTFSDLQELKQVMASLAGATPPVLITYTGSSKLLIDEDLVIPYPIRVDVWDQDLEVAQGATLTISTGAEVFVRGNWIINGTVDIASDGNLYYCCNGQYAPVSGNITGSGKVTYKVYVSDEAQLEQALQDYYNATTPTGALHYDVEIDGSAQTGTVPVLTLDDAQQYDIPGDMSWFIANTRLQLGAGVTVVNNGLIHIDGTGVLDVSNGGLDLQGGDINAWQGSRGSLDDVIPGNDFLSQWVVFVDNEYWNINRGNENNGGSGNSVAFANFAQLRSGIAQLQAGEWAVFSYNGSMPLEITADLVLPENVHLYTQGQDLKIATGATLTMETGCVVDTNGLELDGYLHISPDAHFMMTAGGVMPGDFDRLTIGQDPDEEWRCGQFSVSFHTHTEQDLIDAVNDRSNWPEYTNYGIWVDSPYTITQDITLAGNMQLQVYEPVIIDTGCTLTVEGNILIGSGSLTVNGDLMVTEQLQIEKTFQYNGTDITRQAPQQAVTGVGLAVEGEDDYSWSCKVAFDSAAKLQSALVPRNDEMVQLYYSGAVLDGDVTVPRGNEVVFTQQVQIPQGVTLTVEAEGAAQLRQGATIDGTVELQQTPDGAEGWLVYWCGSQFSPVVFGANGQLAGTGRVTYKVNVEDDAQLEQAFADYAAADASGNVQYDVELASWDNNGNRQVYTLQQATDYTIPYNMSLFVNDAQLVLGAGVTLTLDGLVNIGWEGKLSATGASFALGGGSLDVEKADRQLEQALEDVALDPAWICDLGGMWNINRGNAEQPVDPELPAEPIVFQDWNELCQLLAQLPQGYQLQAEYTGSVIDQDVTLGDAQTLRIINAVTIQDGCTVTVESGAQLEFLNAITFGTGTTDGKLVLRSGGTVCYDGQAASLNTETSDHLVRDQGSNLVCRLTAVDIQQLNAALTAAVDTTLLYEIWLDDMDGDNVTALELTQDVTIPANAVLVLVGTELVNKAAMTCYGRIYLTEQGILNLNEGTLVLKDSGLLEVDLWCYGSLEDAIPGHSFASAWILEDYRAEKWTVCQANSLPLAEPSDLQWNVGIEVDAYGNVTQLPRMGSIYWQDNDSRLNAFEVNIYRVGQAEPVYTNHITSGDVSVYAEELFILESTGAVSGSYYFTVQSIPENGSMASSGVVTSQTWEYVKPANALGQCTDLIHNGQSMIFSLPDDSAEKIDGAHLQVYYRPDSTTQWTCIGTTRVNVDAGSFDAGAPRVVAVPCDPSYSAHGAGEYIFEVFPVSSDITTWQNGATAALQQPFTVSQNYIQVLETLAGIDPYTPDNARGVVQGIAAQLREALEEDTCNLITETLVNLEDNLGILPEMEIQAQIGIDEIAVGGLGLNTPADPDQTIRLTLTDVAQPNAIPEDYDSTAAKQFALTASNVQYSEDGTLQVPVRLLILLPEDMDPQQLVLLHYQDGAAQALSTYVYELEGRWVAAVVLDTLGEFALVQKSEHILTAVAEKAPTYAEAGNIAYWICSCGKWYADPDGQTEITDPSTVVIDKLVEVTQGKAEVTEDVLAGAIQEAASEETVTLPLTQTQQTVTSAQLPVAALESVVKNEKGLCIETTTATVTFDKTAMSAIVEAAGENQTLTLEMVELQQEALNHSQQNSIKNRNVAAIISASLLCGEEKISNFKGGTATVQIPFTPAEGAKGSSYTIVYVAEDGSLSKLKTTYADGYLVATLKHFSEYAVIKDYEDPVDSFSSASVVLDAVLGVRFYTLNTTGTVQIAVGDAEAVEIEASAQSAKPDYREFRVDVFAQDMMNTITATLYDPEGQLLDTQVFTLTDYVVAIQAMDTLQAVKTMAQATLDYCQYAAKVKGNYAGEENSLADIPENAFADHPFMYSTTAPAGTSVHCYLETACALRVRLTSDRYTVLVDGVETAPIMDGSTYVYATEQILPQDYDNWHSFQVLLDGKLVFAGEYSVLAYLGQILRRNSGTADVQNLLRAMYHYYAAAEAYLLAQS